MNATKDCPNCSKPMRQQRSPYGMLWVCSSGCEGTSLVSPVQIDLKLPGLDRGRQYKRAAVPDEKWEHKRFIARVKEFEARVPVLRWLFHVPNGAAMPAKYYRDRAGKTHRYSREGIEFTEMGVRPGVSDLMLLVPRHGFHGWVRELKTLNYRQEDVSVEQREFLEFQREQGYSTGVCGGWKVAWNSLAWYLDELKGTEV